ncbi:hypothetical protein [Allosediminivita pacifica]|nr:hypothetical protein [Allosediminivita pacifica]
MTTTSPRKSPPRTPLRPQRRVTVLRLSLGGRVLTCRLAYQRR